MNRITLRPSSPEMIIRDPVTRIPLPVEGKEVVETSFWRRRIAEGDVLPVEAQSLAPSQKKTKPLDKGVTE